MFNGAFALSERSLRIDSRAWSTHLARLGLMGAIYFSLCYALVTAFMLGAPGLNFFRGIAYLDATFMTLLGIGFFSTSITEEKEEDTLGLMLMAGISPLGLLLGKSVGRVWQSLLLVAVQYPFVLLAVTMGGVVGSQIWAVTASLLAYMVFLAGTGLLCSTLAPRSQTAVAWMMIGLCIYFFVPMIAHDFYLAHLTWLIKQGGTRAEPTIWWTLVGRIGEINVFQEISSVLTSGFSEITLRFQVVSNTLLGCLGAILSWCLFGLATREPSAEATTRGLVPRQPLSVLSTGTRSVRSMSFRLQPSTWKNPFIWKDFHFVAGGNGMMLVRIVYFLGIGLFELAIEDKSNQYMIGWFWLIGFLLWLSVTVDAARVLSRSMQDEVRGQTLAALMMLPRSSIGIVYSKFAGALIGWLPGPLISLVVVLFSPSMQEFIHDAFVQRPEGWMLFIFLTLFFVLVPHLAAVLALYVRWGSVALALGMTIGLFFLVEIAATLWRMMFVQTDFRVTFFLCGSVFLTGVCVACHFIILLRIQALARK